MAVEYEHTQKGKLHYIVLAVAIVYVLTALSRDWPVGVQLILAGVAAGLGLVAAMVGHMTVRDEDEHLAIRYGPLPLLCKRLAYKDMRSVRAGRTTLIDGWGIHWVPRRGWTFNLWGFECIEIDLGGRTIRIGTDDSRQLARFVDWKIRECAARRRAREQLPVAV